MTTFCPKHFTLEDVDCAEPIVACPPRVELDPERHVIVSCGPCNRVRVVPVDRIMKGKVQSSGMCQLDVCAGTVILPEAEALYTPAAIPEGHIQVDQAEFEALREKADLLDKLADDATHETALQEDPPFKDIGTVSGNNPGHDPDTGGINQAAPSKAAKGTATNRKPGK
jgi:hypothetical protein